MLETPFPLGTEFGSALNAAGEHAQHVLPGWTNDAGIWIPQSMANPSPVQIARLIGTAEFGTFYNFRGQRFITTTGYQTFALNVAALMAAFINPSDSGKWVFFDVLEFGAIGATSRFSRLGSASYSGLGSSEAVGNTLGATQTPGSPQEAKAKLYKAGAFTPTGGVIRKVAPMKDAEPYFVHARGSGVLQPGQGVHWTTVEPPGGGSGSYDAYINFEWVEIPSAQAQAIVTAYQALTGV